MARTLIMDWHVQKIGGCVLEQHRNFAGSGVVDRQPVGNMNIDSTQKVLEIISPANGGCPTLPTPYSIIKSQPIIQAITFYRGLRKNMCKRILKIGTHCRIFA